MVFGGWRSGGGQGGCCVIKYAMADLHKSEDKYYPNDQCMMLQNYALEDPVKVQDRPINFNVTEYMISMLQLTFRKLPLIESWYRIKEDYAHLPGKRIT